MRASPYHSNETIKAQTARNLRRQLKQRIGIGLVTWRIAWLDGGA
jgi:hypothetical protein